MTIGAGGLPDPRPDQLQIPAGSGLQAGSSSVVRARTVIVSGVNGGVYVYSGIPATGNLVAAIVGAAGPDPYGLNTVQTAGGYFYGSNNSSIGLISVLGQPTIQLTPPGQTHQTAAGILTAQANNAGASNEFSITTLTSGTEGAFDNSAVLLFSESNDSGATQAAEITLRAGGNSVVNVFKTGMQVTQQITATAGTQSAPTLITTDSWHRVAAGSLKNGWVGSGADINGVIYRMTTDNELEIQFDIKNPVAQTNTAVCTFSAPLVPTVNLKTAAAGAPAAGSGLVWAQLNTTGDFVMTGVVGANDELNGNCRFPLGVLP